MNIFLAYTKTHTHTHTLGRHLAVLGSFILMNIQRVKHDL